MAPTSVDADAEFEGILRARTPRSSGRSGGDRGPGRLVLGEGARVDAKVAADAGGDRGGVQGRDQGPRLILAEKARVEGTVDAQILAVREGAQLNGAVNAGRRKRPGPARPRRRGDAGDPPRAGARLGCALRGDGEVEVTASPASRGRARRPHVRGQRAVRGAAWHHARLRRDRLPRASRRPLPSLLSDNPYLAFARAVALLHPQPRAAGGGPPVRRRSIPRPRWGPRACTWAPLAVVGARVARRRAHRAPPPRRALRGRRRSARTACSTRACRCASAAAWATA